MRKLFLQILILFFVLFGCNKTNNGSDTNKNSLADKKNKSIIKTIKDLTVENVNKISKKDAESILYIINSKIEKGQINKNTVSNNIINLLNKKAKGLNLSYISLKFPNGKIINNIKIYNDCEKYESEVLKSIKKEISSLKIEPKIPSIGKPSSIPLIDNKPSFIQDTKGNFYPSQLDIVRYINGIELRINKLLSINNGALVLDALYDKKNVILKIFCKDENDKNLDKKIAKEITRHLFVNSLDKSIGPEIYKVTKDEKNNIFVIIEKLYSNIDLLKKNHFNWIKTIYQKLEKLHERNFQHTDPSIGNIQGDKLIDFAYIKEGGSLVYMNEDYKNLEKKDITGFAKSLFQLIYIGVNSEDKEINNLVVLYLNRKVREEEFLDKIYNLILNKTGIDDCGKLLYDTAKGKYKSASQVLQSLKQIKKNTGKNSLNTGIKNAIIEKNEKKLTEALKKKERLTWNDLYAIFNIHNFRHKYKSDIVTNILKNYDILEILKQDNEDYEYELSGKIINWFLLNKYKTNDKEILKKIKNIFIYNSRVVSIRGGHFAPRLKWKHIIYMDNLGISMTDLGSSEDNNWNIVRGLLDCINLEWKYKEGNGAQKARLDDYVFIAAKSLMQKNITNKAIFSNKNAIYKNIVSLLKNSKNTSIIKIYEEFKKYLE